MLKKITQLRDFLGRISFRVSRVDGVIHFESEGLAIFVAVALAVVVAFVLL